MGALTHLIISRIKFRKLFWLKLLILILPNELVLIKYEYLLMPNNIS